MNCEKPVPHDGGSEPPVHGAPCAADAICVDNLSKCYEIFDCPRDRLKQFLMPPVRRLTRRVPKSYSRQFWALRDVSFQVPKGQAVGIIGRNGSGKSTLLQIICGTLTPTTGTIAVAGRIAGLLELGSGFNSDFTGRENVYMNGALIGLSQHQIDASFESIEAFAEIGSFIDQPIRTYSSGMAVRLAFAVMAHAQADILVIDEALAVGDAFFVQKCMRYLRAFMEHGTLLFASHDVGAVVNLCQHAIWLDEGRIRAQGAPKDLSNAYLESLFAARQDVRRADRSNHVSNGSSRSSRDMRMEFINSTPYRNDIELFEFQENASSFGAGAVTVTSVELVDLAGVRLSWLVGGEIVVLLVRAVADADVFGPIVGFYLKDRLGQTLFGDNTFLSTLDSPRRVANGQQIEARFEFRFPVLPIGKYSFCVAVAEGTQEEHVQHHWIHDALSIESHASSVSTGLIGIPMTSVELNVS